MFYGLLYGYKYTASAIPTLDGKVCVVTGGNTGIGYETALALVGHGAKKVYIGARTESRALNAIKSIEEQHPNAKSVAEWLPMDLCDLKSVLKAAETVSSKEQKIDILFNNAGVMASPLRITDDGVEEQYQTNVLGHQYLTTLLIPKLLASSDPRVVTTSSEGHNLAKSNTDYASLDSINQWESTWVRYGQSKLGNILLANELARRHPQIMSNSVHPGVIKTELVRGMGNTYGSFVHSIANNLSALNAYAGIMLYPNQGALTQLYLGTAEEVQSKKITAKYYKPIALEGKHSKLVTPELAKTMWETNEKILSDRGFKLSL